MELQPEKKLSRCNDGRQFWAANGNQFWSLHDLAKGLQGMDEHTFGHHVNHERNDFHAWVHDVVGDSTLAQGLLHLHDKHSMMRRVVLRIRFLELMKDSNSALNRSAPRSTKKSTRTTKKAPARKKATRAKPGAKKSSLSKKKTVKRAPARKKATRAKSSAKKTTRKKKAPSRKKSSSRNTRKKSTGRKR